MVVKALESYEEFQKVINGSKPVVIDFCATWCGPCKAISPIFEKLSEGEAGEKIDFYKVDVDAQERIAQECAIRAMPTFLFFKDGNKVQDVTGVNPSALQAAIAALA